MRLESGTKFLFIGDSITDAGRDESGEATPWNPDAAFGKGYVNLLNAQILSEKPESRIRVINRGVSGNTILDLEARWQEDVLAYEADYLSVMIGINDVWRQCDVPLRTDRHVNIELYEQTYRKLLKKTRSKIKGLILAGPYVINNNPQDPMRLIIDDYAKVVKCLADEFEAEYVDTQVEFDRYLAHYHSSSLAWDSIHPNTVGHMLIAKAFMKKLEY